MNLGKIVKEFFEFFDGKSPINEYLLKKRLEAINNANKINFAVVLRKVSEAILEGNYELVCQILEPVVLGLENNEEYKKELNSKFYDFANKFEIILYMEEHKKEADTKVIDTKAPYSLIYYFYASALSNCGKLESAKENFKIALRWNPVSSDILAEYAMHCYREFDYEEFHKQTLNAFKYAYTPEHLGICYKYLGLYYRRIENYEPAKYCFLLCLKYVKDKHAEHLLELTNNSLKELDKQIADDLSSELIEVYGEKFGFPIKPSDTVIAICLSWGERFILKDNKKLAKYFYEKAYNLTKSNYLRSILETLRDN